MKVAILGAGNWGTTISIMLAKKAEISLWTIEKIENRENKKYLPGYKIPDNVHITHDIERSIENADIIIFAIPSQAIMDVISKMKNIINNNAILVSAIKGIEINTLMRMSEIIENEINSTNPICVLSGPTIAREVVQGLPTSCVCASKNSNVAKSIQNFFSSNSFRVYTSDDVIGVELGGALKNVIVIAAGICDGLGLGANTKGALLTRGIKEIARLGVKMGGKYETFSGLSGMGDLITTAFSKYSRNRYLGEQIGRGQSLETILKNMVEVAEGVSTTIAAKRLSEKYNVEMPITHEVYEVLYKNKNPQEGIISLMSRTLKPEIL